MNTENHMSLLWELQSLGESPATCGRVQKSIKAFLRNFWKWPEGGQTRQGIKGEERGGDTEEEAVERRGKEGGWKENRCPSPAPASPEGAQVLNQKLATTQTTAFVLVEAEHKVLVRELATNSSRLPNLYKLVGI